MTPPSTAEHYQALPIGTVLGEYELQQVLGIGGFGIVYLAYDGLLDQHVVIKEYLPTQYATRLSGNTVVPLHSKAQATFEWGLQRFLAEAKALAAFRQHPHIVSVLRYFEANHTAYMVMEFAGETSLQDYLNQHHTLTPKELDILLVPLLDALDTVHAAGLIHRDLKPSNILIHHRQPVLIDFGAARQALGDKTQNLTEVVSQGYSPAEQYYSRSHQGAWSDIYAMAGVLYRCVTGNEPLEATARLVQDQLPKLSENSELRKVYRVSLLSAIDWGLQLKAEERPQTISAWRAKLLAESIQAVELPAVVVSESAAVLSTDPEAQPQTLVRRFAPKWSMVVAASLLTLSGVGFATYSYWRPVPVALPVVAATTLVPAKVEQHDVPAEPQRVMPEQSPVVPRLPLAPPVMPLIVPPTLDADATEDEKPPAPATIKQADKAEAAKPRQKVTTKIEEKPAVNSRKKTSKKRKKSREYVVVPTQRPVYRPRPRQPATCDSRDELCRQLRG